jgi:hypothetical protein
MSNRLFRDIKALNPAALNHLAQDITLADWDKTPAGDPCAWCTGGNAEPDDEIDAQDKLCRGHLAEYLGESLESLDRAEMEAFHDMGTLGYLD